MSGTLVFVAAIGGGEVEVALAIELGLRDAVRGGDG